MKDKRSLTIVMDRAEIEQLLKCATNIKQRALLSTMYADGVRPIELTMRRRRRRCGDAANGATGGTNAGS